MDRLYAFAPGLSLRVTGPGNAIRHFDAEYGRAAVPERDAAATPADVEVVFAGRARAVTSPAITGTHKGTSWRAALTPPETHPLRATVHVTGLFGLSLVQSYVAEPLLAVGAVRAGLVLLPAAGLASNGGVVAIVGRSRTGKSSAAARASAHGLLVLGDDRFLVAPDGTCLPFPRRLRAYADLPRIAPAFVAGLPRRVRTALAARAALRRLTRAFVDLPVLVQVAAAPAGTLSRDTVPARTRLVRIVLVEREGARGAGAGRPAALPAAGPSGMDPGPAAVSIPPARALATIRDVLRADLAPFAAAPAASGWPEAVTALVDRELGLLSPIVEAVPATLLRIPDSSRAPEAIGALASLAGLPS